MANPINGVETVEQRREQMIISSVIEAIHPVGDKVSCLCQPSGPTVDEERNFDEAPESSETSTGRPPPLNKRLQSFFIAGLVGDDDSMFVTAIAIDANDHLSEAQQQLLERPLQRIRSWDGVRSANDGKQRRVWCCERCRHLNQ